MVRVGCHPGMRDTIGSLWPLFIVVVLLALLFETDAVMAIVDTIVAATGAPVQTFLAELNIYTTERKAGVVGFFLIFLGLAYVVDWIDPES